MATASQRSVRSTAIDLDVKEELFKRELAVMRFLGKGSYSKVYQAMFMKEQKMVAVKVIQTDVKNEYVRKFLPRELELIKELQHDNVVKVFSSVVMPGSTCMVIEYCENGDLLDRIKKLRRIPDNDAKFFFRQLIESLKYLEAKKIVHRDLKCENIFLDKFDNVKLGDFGFARFLRDGEKSSTYCGSRVYVAPEVLRASKYTGNTVDVWSAGIVLYIMTTGVMPYDDRNIQKMVDRQLSHKIRFPRIEMSSDLRSIIYDILHPYPPSRPTYKEMCIHPWLQCTPYVFRNGDDCHTAETFDVDQPFRTALN